MPTLSYSKKVFFSISVDHIQTHKCAEEGRRNHFLLCFASSAVVGPRMDRVREQEVWTSVAHAFVIPVPLLSRRSTAVSLVLRM